MLYIEFDEEYGVFTIEDIKLGCKSVLNSIKLNAVYYLVNILKKVSTGLAMLICLYP